MYGLFHVILVSSVIVVCTIWDIGRWWREPFLSCSYETYPTVYHKNFHDLLLSVTYGYRIDSCADLKRFSVTVEAATSQAQSVTPANIQPFRRSGGDGGKNRLPVCRRLKTARLTGRTETQVQQKSLRVIGRGTWFFNADSVASLPYKPCAVVPADRERHFAKIENAVKVGIATE